PAMTTSNTSTFAILNTVCTRLSPVPQKWLAFFAATRLALHEPSDRPAGVLVLAGNQVESSATTRWLGTQLPAQWKATESEGCPFTPDRRDLDNGEKLDSGSVTKCSLACENVSCQSLARESSIQASNAESPAGPPLLRARIRARGLRAAHLRRSPSRARRASWTTRPRLLIADPAGTTRSRRPGIRRPPRRSRTARWRFATPERFRALYRTADSLLSPC